MNWPTYLKTVLLFFTIALIGACTEKDVNSQQTTRDEMLIYCGITMVNPMKEIASKLEPELGIKITITQGGSEDLYQSLKAAKKGDLYLPGSASYRKRHLEEGLLGDSMHVGFNQAAIMVAKGNPKQITNDLTHMLRDDISVIIGAPESGSIGRETKRILDGAGIYNQVRENIIYLSTDSRNINYSLRQRDADLSINWRATAFFPENIKKLDIIDLDPEVAVPKKLVLNLLTFSAMPEKAKRFMEYAASEPGQDIFRKHGFLDRTMH